MVEISRGTSVVQTVKPNEATLSMGVSGQNEFILGFDLTTAYTFELGDTVTVKGQTYYLNGLPSIEKKSDHHFAYRCVFEASYYDLTKIQFMYEGMNEFYFNGTLQDIMDIMFENVHRVYGAGHLNLGYVESTEFRNLYFKNQSCMQVLYAMMDEWEMEYYFDTNELNVSGSIGTDSGETFRYGKGQGLYSITREKVQSKDIITRLWALGSERNIPYDYRPATGDTRNLLKRSGAVDLVDAIDIDANSTKTYEGGNRWKWVNGGGGTSRIRMSVDHTLLTDSNPYVASVYWEGNVNEANVGVQWCDGTISYNDDIAARRYATHTRVYDDTYDYMTVHIASGETIILYDAQIEAGTTPTAYEGGYALTGGRFTRRLMFAAPGSHYLESNVSTYGLVEATKTFDDIYPRFTGHVTTIGDELEFCCSDVDFDVNLYLIGGVQVTVHFNTGDCAGYEFTLDANDESGGYEHTGNTLGDRYFRIIQNQDKQGYVVPTSAGIRPAVGDEFVILNIEMPSSYVSSAETELQTVAQAYLDQNDVPRVSYTVNVDPEYAVEQSLSFVIGDAVTLVDSDLGVNRLIRIINIDYDLKRDGAMKLTLSEDLEPTIIQRLISEEERIDTILSINPVNQTDMMTGYRSILELQHLVFDGTSYFDPEKIKPLSIETLMLTVGSKWYAFILECTMDGNYNGTTTGFSASAGQLVHFTMDETAPVTWQLNSNLQTGLTSAAAYYIYAYCHKTLYTDATNVVLVDTAQRDVDGTTHWNFMVGVLHSAAGGFRDISLTYGMSQINGGFITTGKIESIDSNTYFDLNNSEIGGKIAFAADSSGYSNITDIPTSLDDINSTEYSKYEERSKVWQQATAPTTGMQVGDIWIDTDDDSVYYFTGTIWTSATVIDALEAYLAAAMGKTIYAQDTAPTAGMVEGDIWIDTNDSNKTYVYYDSTWTETNSAEALAAYALADGKVQTFYQTTAPTTGMDQGDFWVDTDDTDGFNTYVYSGATWNEITVTDAIQAISDAADAQATADGKVTTFVAASAPTAEGVGDLWYNTTTGTLHRWDGSDWNQDIADITQTIIDGGLVTTGRIEVVNESTSVGGLTGYDGTVYDGDEVGLWLGSTYANRTTAPFRVQHNGTTFIQSKAGSVQRIEIDGPNGTMSWYNSSNAEVIKIDDTISASWPGMLITGGIIRWLASGADTSYSQIQPGGITCQKSTGQAGNVVASFIADDSSDVALWTDGRVYMDAIDSGSTSNILYYDSTTKFVSYAAAPSGSGTVTSVASGDGMDFTTITGTGTVHMGTPTTCTPTTTNDANGTTHEHAITGFLTGNESITLSGDVSGSGTTSIAVTIASSSVEAGMLNTNVISGQTALASGLGAADELLVSDAGVLKKMDVSVLEVYMQNELNFLTGNQTITLSGHVTGSGTTSISTTISADTVTEAMLDPDFVEDMTALAAEPASTDDLIINDGTVVKKIAISYIADYMDSNLDFGSGDGTVTNVNNGNGMNFTNITASGTVTLGTPSNCSPTTSNAVTTSSHTHAITGVPETGTVTGSGYITFWSDGTDEIAGNRPFMLSATALYPSTANSYDLGTSTYYWNDLFINPPSATDDWNVRWNETGRYLIRHDDGGSDIRLKENIKPIGPVTEGMMKINGYLFNYTEEGQKEYGMDGRTYPGLIAQEVENVFPDLVKENKRGYLRIFYEKMGPYFVEAIKEQNSEVEQLKGEVHKLRKQVEILINKFKE